jgi:hypothetical protein
MTIKIRSFIELYKWRRCVELLRTKCHHHVCTNYSYLLFRPPSLLFNGYQHSFPGIKRSGCEFNDSPQSSARVKNEWLCTSAFPLCLHRVDGEYFTFCLLYIYLSSDATKSLCIEILVYSLTFYPVSNQASIL